MKNMVRLLSHLLVSKKILWYHVTVIGVKKLECRFVSLRLQYGVRHSAVSGCNDGCLRARGDVFWPKCRYADGCAPWR